MPRVKQVHTNAMVAHLWANQSQESARNSNSSFWFDKKSIYSYRTCIARIIAEQREGVPVVFFTDRTSSPTTSAHQTKLYYATRGEQYIRIYVPYVEESAEYNAKFTRTAIQEYMQHHAALRSYPQRRHYFYKYLRPATELLRILNFYFRTGFDVEPDNPVYAAMFALHQADGIKQEAAWAKKEQARKEREQKKELLALHADKGAILKEYPQYYTDTGNIVEDVPRAKKALWKAGIINRLGWYIHGEYALLRVNKDNTCVETSLGASVRMEFVPRIWRGLLKAKQSYRNLEGVTFDTPISADHFKITGIYTDADGLRYIQAGCHRILISELEGIARQLNLPMED